MTKIVIVTGGFDPVHSGHLAYFRAARTLGDRLIVGLNSDAWLTRKKGRPFMPIQERLALVGNLNMVDEVVTFDDADGSSRDAICVVRAIYPDADIVFANGGDRTPENIPEMTVQDTQVSFEFGVGGEHKRNSSSWILQEWKAPKTNRQWGYYRVLHEVDNHTKVKELTVEPGQRLSMQRHQHRAEHWFVAEGTATVYTINKSTDSELQGVYHRHQSLYISKTQWHQLCNEGTEPLKVVEIQYGENCIEDDIERQ